LCGDWPVGACDVVDPDDDDDVVEDVAALAIVAPAIAAAPTQARL
jgi:hypothetical protein